MAHRLLIGKGMITLNLKRILPILVLLPLFAVAADDCALSDPTLTVQAYTVNPHRTGKNVLAKGQWRSVGNITFTAG